MRIRYIDSVKPLEDYKAKVLVYDGNKLIAQTELKQCSCAKSVWGK